MQRVCGGELIVDPVKEIFLVAFVMHHAELGRIEKSAAVEPANGDEISPPVVAIAEIEAAGRRSKRPMGAGYGAVWRRFAQARARPHVDHQACLVTIFGRWRSGNYFE